jgi:hypothetical protein
MTSRSEIEAEQLVFSVARELELTELEFRRVGMFSSQIVADLLAEVRLEIKQGVGRTVTVEDYRLPENGRRLELLSE